MGGEQEMEVMEKRKEREECDEMRASCFIRCLLFVCFQAPFLFKVSEATLWRRGRHGRNVIVFLFKVSEATLFCE